MTDRFVMILALTSIGAISSVSFFVTAIEAMRPDRVRGLRIALAVAFLIFLLTAFGCLVAAIRVFDSAA